MSFASYWLCNGVVLNIHGIYHFAPHCSFAGYARNPLTGRKRRNGRIIALLVLAGVLLIGFIAVQILKPKTATIPPRIFCQRSILAGFCATFCIGASMMIVVYYLPIYFVSALPAFDVPFLKYFLGPWTIGCRVAFESFTQWDDHSVKYFNG